MSYRIEYGTAIPRKFRVKRPKSHIRTLTAIGIFLFVLTVRAFWPEGRNYLGTLLLPGKPSATEQAYSDMLSELVRGIPMEEAMVAFCQQIVDYGKVSSD